MSRFTEYAGQTEDFIFMEDTPVPSDVIFVPGNGFPQMAEKAAELYKAGFAPCVLPSGRYSVTVGHFGGVLSSRERYCGPYETEWEFLRDVLVKNGVEEERILREDQATYTWQNALFSRKVCDHAGLEIKKALLCCKNVHSRRAYMYYRHAFPEAEIRVIPCCTDGITKENWRQSEEGIRAVLGEAQRILTQFSLYMGGGSF